MGFPERLLRAYRAFRSEEPAEASIVRSQSVGEYPRPMVPWPAQSMDVPVGYNTGITVRSTEPVSSDTLRSMARSCDLVRIAIQMSKDQLRGLEWDITVVPGNDSSDELETKRKKIRAFFRRPDPMNDIGFHDWFGAWLEDFLVLDAATLLVVKDRSGRLVALPNLDGATIKPLLDPNGFVPLAPNPAYSQIIDGSVVSNFTRDQLLYTPYNVQPDRPYGFSPVEMVITSAHIALKRQLFGLNYYTEGSVPDYLIVAPNNWTVEQIKQAQLLLDDYLSGNLSRRRKMKLVPAGMEPKAMKQPDFSVAVDEWLARIIGAVFGVAPHLLLRQRTKQQAGAMEEQQTYLGLQPKTRFFAEIMTERVIRPMFNEPRLQFSWLSDKRDEQEFNLRRATTMLPLGAISIDEMLLAEGRQPIGIPRYIQQPNGLLFLTDRVLEGLKNGKFDYIDSRGVAVSIDDPPPPTQPAASGQPAKPAPAPGQAADEGKDPAQQAQSKKSVGGGDEAQRELVVGEIKKWRQCVLADLKRGLPVREFKCEFVPEWMAVVLGSKLADEKDAVNVKVLFAEFIDDVRRDAI